MQQGVTHISQKSIPEKRSSSAKSSEIDSFSYALLEIVTSLGKKFDLKRLIDKILHFTLKELSAEQGSILLVENSSPRLKIISAKGLPKEVVKKGYVTEKDSISHWVIKHKRALILQGNVKDRRFISTVGSQRHIKSALSVPLKAENKVIGVINVSRNSGEEFTQEDLNKMKILAGQAAMAIENARLYEEKMQAMRMATIGQVVSGISHCVKNILTGIKGGLWLCENHIKSGDMKGLILHWELLRRNIDRLTLLTLDMLDLAKKRKPIVKKSNLMTIIAEALSTVRLGKRNKQYEVVTDISKDLYEAYIDEDQILRCFLNLLDNAVDALPEQGGVIKISARKIDYSPGTEILGHRWGKAKQLILIDISDNGQGIDENDIPHIFEPFFSTKGSKGTGLGLAATRKIIEEHKGRISVESERGKGTTFHIVIPQFN